MIPEAYIPGFGKPCITGC